jgi:hypothetical protein
MDLSAAAEAGSLRPNAMKRLTEYCDRACPGRRVHPKNRTRRPAALAAEMGHTTRLSRCKKI